MKICGACLVELPEEEFSKKQWHMKKVRRCKGCVAANLAIQEPKKEVAPEHRARLPLRNRKKRDPHTSSAETKMMGVKLRDNDAHKNTRPYEGLRFKAGDRVECMLDGYCPGFIIWRNYREDDGQVYPYQVRLDTGVFIYVPFDDDRCIKRSTLPRPAESPLLFADPSNDEELFKQPPAREECPICMIELPLHTMVETSYQTCCGKVICSGCRYSARKSGIDDCAFCRAPRFKSIAEYWKRIYARVEVNDPEAISLLGTRYRKGGETLQKDEKKGVELLLKAADLGMPSAHHNLAYAYKTGSYGVEVDGEKARYHYETSAKAGHVGSRYFLGLWELESGNVSRAYKHWIVAAQCGCANALEKVKKGFKYYGEVTKEEWEHTLKAHKASIDEMTSEHREKARNAKERN